VPLATPSIHPSHPSAGIHLPTPDENPHADIVIFDGNCRFCRAQVERLARWDRHGRRLAFLSLHDPEVAKRFPDLTYDQLMEEMYVVDRFGRRHGGPAAIRYLSRRLPRLYFLAPLLHLPFSLPFWRWAYRQIAKRRYGLGGAVPACDDEACRMHWR
jgi:predicted DCC family thiol-disulfide oxidoreductase YuxK